jgi:hypothetical protein
MYWQDEDWLTPGMRQMKLFIEGLSNCLGTYWPWRGNRFNWNRIVDWPLYIKMLHAQMTLYAGNVDDDDNNPTTYSLNACFGHT